jgi:hypothetical protein
LTKYVQLIRNWFIVAILASSLITSCSSTSNEASAGNKDCEILLEANKILPRDNSTLTLGTLSDYYSKIEESQLLFDEPRVREAISEYLDSMNVSEDEVAFVDEEWRRVTKSFANKIDIYCNSL